MSDLMFPLSTFCDVHIPNKDGTAVEFIVTIKIPVTMDDDGDLCVTEEGIRAIDNVKLLFLNRFRTI